MALYECTKKIISIRSLDNCVDIASKEHINSCRNNKETKAEETNGIFK